MTSKTLNLEEILSEDDLGTKIADKFLLWENLRQSRVDMWKEILEYVFATDTTKTTNAQLPWANKTTIPKMCQIRDNLHANYLASLFPNRNWLVWEGSTKLDESPSKKDAIQSYMRWVVGQNRHYLTTSRLVYDFIDYGNCFVMPEWVDETYIDPATGEKVGYVGPVARRISPLDIVFDPTVETFERSPKIIRSIISIGELKEMLETPEFSTPDQQEWATSLFKYLKDLRYKASSNPIDESANVKNRIYEISGYDSYSAYLTSDDVEVLTFYGDIYDHANDTFLKNYVIKVVDRHKIIYKAPSTHAYAYAPIFHAGWRMNPDNLWAHTPLENLVGLQYRIDHLENMKADCFDLTAYPVLKIRGYVEDFTWGPMERIYVRDDSDVSMMSPDINALQADNQIALLEAKMEELAGSPREAMGFRTPGEKTKYEVQSLENAAGRIFQNKIGVFEQQIVENVLNGMLALARTNMTEQVIRVIDDEFQVAMFKELTRYDITGIGRLRPVAARHFAEKAQMVQNLTQFFGSQAGNDPQVMQHFSAKALAKLWENILELEPYKIVSPFVRISEQAEGSRLSSSTEEQLLMETQTASGIGDDFDLNPSGPDSQQ